MFGNPRAGANADRHMTVDTDALAASPHQRIVMLFDGALSLVGTAIMQIRHRDIESKGSSTTKAGEIAHSLASLNDDIVRLLVDANISNDIARLAEVRGVLAQTRDAWVGIAHVANHPGAAA